MLKIKDNSLKFESLKFIDDLKMKDKTSKIDKILDSLTFIKETLVYQATVEVLLLYPRSFVLG